MVCLALISFEAYSQKHASLPEGDWYVINKNMQARLSISSEYLILNSIDSTVDGYQRPADTIKVVKQGEHGLVLMEKDGEDKLAMFRVHLEDEGKVVRLSEVKTSESRQELLDFMDANEPPTDLELFDANYIYSKEIYEGLKAARGLDQISAEHLKDALYKRYQLGKRMEDFMNQNPELGLSEYRIGRMEQLLFNKTVIVSGYNPFLEVAYNFADTFSDDEEIMKLLDEN